MFELNNDTFVYSENVFTNSAETIVEGEIYISDEMPNIEKIISVNGKVKVNNVTVSTNKTAIYGILNFDIVYRSEDETKTSSGTKGKIDFMEEMESPGSKEKMEASSNIYIDYIDAEVISDRKIQIKAVINISTNVFNKRTIEYVSDVSNATNFEMKTKNIKYSEAVNFDVSPMSVNESIELDINMDEILDVLKVDASAYITATDIMNERMLIEGMYKIGVLYLEDNEFSSVNYTAREFPFTHYAEMNNSDESMLRKMNVELSNIEYDVDKNEDSEKKAINFKSDFDFSCILYKNINKDIITDGYSTISDIELVSNNVNLESIEDIMEVNTDFEKAFDISDGSVKDVYKVNIVPKISERRILNDKLVIEGFLDVNLIYLNGDVDKMDGTNTNLPFNISINLNDDQKKQSIDVDLRVYKYGCYRKSNTSVLINAEIVSEVTFKSKKTVSVISQLNDLGYINVKEMPSLVFRVVQSGETLWDIAKNYNVSMQYLMKLNEIPSEQNIAVGDKILIARRI